jgi:cysteine synthase
VKDRAAHALVDHAIASGELKPGGTIVQGTGGNTGVSLAMIAKSRGYKAHVCIPENISPDKVDLLRMLGAEVTVCPCVPYTDPRSYMSMAASIAASTPGAAKPCQFECIANADAHYKGTGAEIWAQTAGDVVRSIHWFPYDRVGVVNADP